MNPEESAGEYVDGGRIPEKDKKDSAQEVGTTPEPAVPLISTGTGQHRCSRGTGGLPLPRPDDDTPSTEVQDLRSQTPQKHNGWDWPPTCINTNGQHATPTTQPISLLQNTTHH